jgi:hypothetical protein
MIFSQVLLPRFWDSSFLNFLELVSYPERKAREKKERNQVFLVLTFTTKFNSQFPDARMLLSVLLTLLLSMNQDWTHSGLVSKRMRNKARTPFPESSSSQLPFPDAQVTC